MSYPFDPDYCVPTSEVLREWLDDNHITTKIAAAGSYRRGTPENKRAISVLDAVLDDAVVTTATAHTLARVTGIAVGFWQAFDHNYRKGLAAGKIVSRG